MKYVEENIIDEKKKIVFVFLYLFAAFSLVGQRILIYPLTAKLTMAGIWVFTVATLWFIPVINTAVYGLDRLTNAVISSDRENMGKRKFVIIAAVLLLLPAAYSLYANNPGISSPDTYDTMLTNAHNLRGMYDWHPAFYCMILNVILIIWDSTYAVIFVQYFFWCFVMAELLLYLRKKGMKEPVLLVMAFLSGINAGNFLHLNTIWKDIPYTLSLLWILIILAKLSLDFEEYKGKRFVYVELIAALIGVFFYRKNGIASFAVIAAAMLIILHGNKKVWISLTVTAALIITIKGPVYSYFEVEDTGRNGMYVGLSQDILGVYYSGGEVSEDTLKMINVMTECNNAEYSYTPTWSNQVYPYELDVEPSEFIAGYIDTFLHNPVLMVRAVIAREDAVWNIFAGRDAVLECVNFHGTRDGVDEWNDYYPVREYNSLYLSMSSMTGYTASSQWISSIEWRSGLLTLLGILAFAYMIYKRGLGKYILVAAPLVGHLLSLLLSTGWSDFRYFWPLNLMNLAVILIAVVVGNEFGKESKDEGQE